MRIVVLYGGNSAERAVSLVSGARVTTALRARGHTVGAFDWNEEPLAEMLLDAMHGCDAVFLALHGGAGENGALQAMLEREGIAHYIGSAPSGATLAMQKHLARECVRAFGIPVARGGLWMPGEPPPVCAPLVCKPPDGGSSVGLCFVNTPAELEKFTPSVPLLCEEYLTGREYTVGILEGEALPVVEIRPIAGAYDYAHKYTVGACEELCPAPIDAAATAHLQALACKAFAALGLRDFARIDFRENAVGEPHFLEANTLPGMTETSLLPLAAATAGIPFPMLCERMCMCAAKRKKN
ncbi:MAG: D-alanine--D-alanine ligase [Clostridia bacterium]|nr:D-alanine--D-alanine ligase [Clostridia bacterium]